MADLGDLAGKAEKLAKDHPEQTDQGIQKAADAADKESGGKYTGQIQGGEKKAEDYLSGDAGQGQGDQPQGQGQGNPTSQGSGT